MFYSHIKSDLQCHYVQQPWTDLVKRVDLLLPNYFHLKSCSPVSARSQIRLSVCRNVCMWTECSWECALKCMHVLQSFVCMWVGEGKWATACRFYLLTASFHLGRRTPLCHSGWHMERQPPARGVQEGSAPCHCLSSWLCPPSCPHAGRSRGEVGGVLSWRVTDWQVTGEASQTASATDLLHISQSACVPAYKHIKPLCLTPLGCDHKVNLGSKRLPLRPLVGLLQLQKYQSKCQKW